MNDNVHHLPVEKKRRRPRSPLNLPRADVIHLDEHRPHEPSGNVALPASREEVQAMFDELAHHLLLTIRVITSRLR